MTNAAERHAILQSSQSSLKALHILWILVEEMQRNPLSTLRPNAGEPGELVDDVL